METKTKIKFGKMNGCGNDYVFVDASQNPLPHDLAKLAVAVSNRNYGIGSDGLVLIYKETTPRMRIFNADGSEAEMCGNAIRCVARYLADNDCTPTHIDTLAGKKSVTVCVDTVEKNFTSVQVNMGTPSIINGLVHGYTLVNTGNPHAVRVVKRNGKRAFEEAERLSKSYAGGINVELVEVLSRKQVRIRVYERGSGETLACGTGATATVFALRKMGLVDPAVTCILKGGELQITENPDGTYTMSGNAEYNFTGVYDYYG